MKKLFGCIIILVVAGLILSGCTDTDNAVSDTDEAQEQALSKKYPEDYIPPIVPETEAVQEPSLSKGPPPPTTICHKPGTPAQKTLTLPSTAIPGHLGHGDVLGPCAGACPAFDRIIDADGTASAGDGTPGSIDPGLCGAPLSTFPYVFNSSGLDGFDNDGDGLWTFDTDGPGPLGDDIHVEDTAFCPTAAGFRNGSHDVGFDCVVLDPDGSLFTGQPVSYDLEVGASPDPRVKYHDANGNGSWDDGEDIVLDVNLSGFFD